MKKTFNSRLILILFGLMLTFSAQAENGLAWTELSKQQQRVLKRMQPKWDTLKPEQRRRFQKGANRWLTMTP
ncbi:MAG: DUF3106 domain-containing protein, partial [Cycloclasticus sp.]|nr:DUF3106 domain-containing protein [Cycloclasticus sp.]